MEQRSQMRWKKKKKKKKKSDDNNNEEKNINWIDFESVKSVILGKGNLQMCSFYDGFILFVVFVCFFILWYGHTFALYWAWTKSFEYYAFCCLEIDETLRKTIIMIFFLLSS